MKGRKEKRALLLNYNETELKQWGVSLQVGSAVPPLNKTTCTHKCRAKVLLSVSQFPIIFYANCK